MWIQRLSLFVFLLICLVSFFRSSAQVQIFQKTFGTSSSYEEGLGILKDNSGGYWMYGTLYQDTINIDDFQFIKLDNSFNILFSGTFGGVGYDGFLDGVQDANNGVVLCGYSHNSSDFNIKVVNINQNGNIIWNKEFDRFPGDIGYSIVSTSDSGYILAGSTAGITSADFGIIKLNNSGDTLWTRQIGHPTKSEDVKRIIQTLDGGYLLVGTTSDQVLLSSDILILKLDIGGNLLWHQRLVGVNDDFVNGLIEIEDSTFFIAGHTNSFNSVIMDICLIHLSKNGNLLWGKSYGDMNLNYCNKLIATEDNNLLIIGSSGLAQQQDPAILCIDTAGSILWQRSYGGNQRDLFYDGISVTDNYYFIGTTQSFSLFSENYFIATDYWGDAGCNYLPMGFTSNTISFLADTIPIVVSSGFTIIPGNDTPVSFSNVVTLCSSPSTGLGDQNTIDVSVHPNPTSGEIMIKVEEGMEFEMVMLNYLGEKIINGRIEKSGTVNLSTLSDGIYFLILFNNNGVRRVVKVVKE